MWEKLILKLLPVIIAAATPTLKTLMCQFVSDLKKKAEATPNPIDNILADVLANFICPKE
jgi:hypothetical protein